MATVKGGGTHFYIGPKNSYLKISEVNNVDFKAFSTEVNYNGEKKNIETEKWYEFSEGRFSESNFMNDKDYPIKMVSSNLSPFLLLREKFMNTYSYFINNIDHFPTVKNFSNFKGEKFLARQHFLSEYFKKVETTFRRVKSSYSARKGEALTASMYRDFFHHTDLRLITLRGLSVLNPNETIEKNRLLYSGVSEYIKEIESTVYDSLKKAKINESNQEYISRQ